MYLKLYVIQIDDGMGWRDLTKHTHYTTLADNIDVIKKHWDGKEKRPKFRQLIRTIKIDELEIKEIEINPT